VALLTDVSKSEIVELDLKDTKITLRVIKKSGKKVRICIDAPKTVSISKKEMPRK
jgi:sRNA-binding carbon storage regulator CsrA